MSIITDLAPVALGGVLVWGGSWLQHMWTTKREDRQRVADQNAQRVQYEREAIADLIAAMLEWVPAIVNLGLEYEAARSGGVVEGRRVQAYEERNEAFGTALARARVSIRNPAARSVLDNLLGQQARMVGHLSLRALGQRSSDFGPHFREFRSVASKARLTLEKAALEWDGSLPESNSGMENGIDSVRRNAPDARVDDQT